MKFSFNEKLFDNLFVLDMANNHQGSLDHGKRIINEFAKRIKFKKDINVAFKFQFRNLDTFIHKNHIKSSFNKHIHRFDSTRLDLQTYQQLFNTIKDNKLITCCTPFDEQSVDHILDMNFDIVKVASCSSRDWPLLEKVAESGKPVILSTGGLTYNDIDDVVSFFEHRGVDFAIMHCISIYPTPNEDCNLANIRELKLRYPGKIIGWSTHEDPNNYEPIQVAYSMGAKIFERHVGINTKEHTLNKYSSTPDNVDKWIDSFVRAKELIGHSDRIENLSEKESILDLKRGVYAKKDISPKSYLKLDDVYFAMPAYKNQLTSSEWNDSIKLKQSVKKDKQIKLSDISFKKEEKKILKDALHTIKAILNKANVILNSNFEVEYSHHYGVKNFYKYGATIINCINREYCKKLIVMLPNQKHPAHFHKRKEETFQVLYGTLTIFVDGKKHILSPGQTCLIQPGVWHSFSSNESCIVEEISTTHYNNDSFYKDKKINSVERDERKTFVQNWGRFQI